MSVYNYKALVYKWEQILDKVKVFGGEARELVIEPPATKEEIENKEKVLGLSLPISFKEILLNFSRHVEFNWYLPEDANLPNEFREIFSGEICWSLEWIEDLNPLAKEFKSYDGEECELKNKLQFYQVGNGDILAFDMEQDKEQSIVYWSHEEDEIFFIADSFITYLKKVTELYGIGTEIWQMEPFLDEKGLNSNSSESNRWKNWFNTFSNISFDKGRNDLESLIKYIEFHGKIKEKEIKVLKGYDKNLLFKKVLERLKIVDDCQKEILYKIIGEALGLCAADWVRYLWENDNEIDSVFRSYLTSRCLPRDEGLSKVIEYVEGMFNDKIKGYEAKRHLCYFRDNRVISWIKNYISNSTTKDQWYELYACSQPTWEDIKEWLYLGGRYRLVVLNALEYMLNSWTSLNIKGEYKIINTSSREEIICILKKIKDEEILKSKKRKYYRLIEEIDLII
ncbi:SMI1/KNR4 family protein [Tepidibacter hydrothermalis]|uniref:SMI1/KNR4 family protein n=1 Tax=Tepidibacter hydrothermalis TaxID=3036126 RepID=A0ABY8EJ07_9FIRM|nr:SMI1/KNR4 family protein [Tepidibacter hydrothermalis]WFD11924.1 SMI1/KNR4 family protein [Tepidibacter hydrothermalis]